jgi:uncharacterized protein (DUF1330 family)
MRARNQIPISRFEEAIQATHGARSMLLRRQRVVERFHGKTVWDGEVLVFALEDHDRARRCYAWEMDGEVTVVLHAPPVEDARAAVRVALLAALGVTLRSA